MKALPFLPKRLLNTFRDGQPRAGLKGFSMPKTYPKNISKTMRLRRARAESEGREFFVPVRQVMVRSPVRILRELFSVKMRTYLPCESAIEYDHATVLDVRPDVVRILAQPVEVSYELDGKQRRTVPDFRIDLADGTTELHECRTDKEAALEQVMREATAITEACMSRREHYVVVKESDVRREPRLSNARLLRDQRMRPRSVAVERAVLALLAANGDICIGDVCSSLSVHCVSAEAVLAMALRGTVALDWETAPVGPTTRVSFPRV